MSSKLCLFAALFLPGLAEATVTVSSVPSGPAYITYSVTTVSPGVFDVSITRQSYAGDVFVDIRGLVTDSIRNVTVNSGASPRKTFFSVRVRVRATRSRPWSPSSSQAGVGTPKSPNSGPAAMSVTA